jgi:hypothetical protein
LRGDLGVLKSLKPDTFGRGLLLGALSALGLVGLMALLGRWLPWQMSGASARMLLDWVGSNLGLSLLPFFLVTLMFVRGLRRLLVQLRNPHPDLARIAHMDHSLDIWASLFFATGVIWTAIGMRSSLLAALGGVEVSQATALGGYDLLKRLVDGGILLALSTTIVGGVGGYLMRLLKSLLVGARLQRCYSRAGDEHMDRLLAAIARIESRLPASPRAAGDDPG